MAIIYAYQTDQLNSMVPEYYRTNQVRHVFKDCVNGSWVYEEPIQKISTELLSIQKDCAEFGWDGYNAAPISAPTIDYAKSAISQLTNIPQPELAPNADGEISFEWYKAPTQQFLFSIGEKGNISYAGRIGNERIYGNAQYLGTLPGIIEKTLSRIFGLTTPVVVLK